MTKDLKTNQDDTGSKFSQLEDPKGRTHQKP